MLMMAEGTINRTLTKDELSAVHAWFGHMADDGFLHHGYLDQTGRRLWILITSPTITAARQRLASLPVVADGSVALALTQVSALRVG